jgi:hypothetical protein
MIFVCLFLGSGFATYIYEPAALADAGSTSGDGTMCVFRVQNCSMTDGLVRLPSCLGSLENRKCGKFVQSKIRTNLPVEATVLTRQIGLVEAAPAGRWTSGMTPFAAAFGWLTPHLALSFAEWRRIVQNSNTEPESSKPAGHSPQVPSSPSPRCCPTIVAFPSPTATPSASVD